MGMDTNANLAFGIKLPEDFKIEDEELCIWEALEELIIEGEYKHLEIITFGSCDDSEYVIASVNYSVDWTSIPINIEDLQGNYTDELENFCINLGFEYDPQWYFGCYTSY